MERTVVAETANVVCPVEALDPIGYSVHLEDVDVVWYRGHCVDLEVWGEEVKEVTG